MSVNKVDKHITRNEWVNNLQDLTRVPSWLIEEVWSKADIETLVECETEKEYQECIDEFKYDVELRIKMLQKIKENLNNIPFEKPKR